MLNRPDEYYERLISKSDLHFKGITQRSEEGLPIGNGRMGSMVWVTPTALKLQINRSDVFASSCTGNSFPEMDSDYCGGCGFVDIHCSDCSDDAFAGEDTVQHLSAYQGMVDIKSMDISVTALVWQAEDVMAIEIDDRRQKPQPIRVGFRVLRFVSQYTPGIRPQKYPGGVPDDSESVVRTNDHYAYSTLKIRGENILLSQRFVEGDFFLCTAMAGAVLGRKAKAVRNSEMEYSLNIEPGNGPVIILISTFSSMNPEEDADAKALQLLKLAKARGFDGILHDNLAWWREFWRVSHVDLTSDNGEADFVSLHCNYFMYLMASSSRGRYAPRFGGMLWNTGGDYRMWGSQYWWFNQSCLYCGIPATGHFELMDPMFDQYHRLYSVLSNAARQQWRSRGIWIPETAWFDGLEDLPEDIADEMSALYLLEKPWDEMSERFSKYASGKNSFEARWNWIDHDIRPERQSPKKDRGFGPFGYAVHIFNAAAKIAFLYWLRYDYTMDRKWLAEKAYPMLKGVAEFYTSFPNIREGADGRLHMYHVNNHEGNWDCTDPVSELAAMHGVITIAIRAAEILGVDIELREGWKEFISKLTPLPTNEHPDAISRRKAGEDEVFAGALKPVRAGSNGYVCTTDPIVLYDLITLETKDAGLLNIAKNTYKREYNEHKADGKVHCYELETLASAAARMGHAEGFRELVLAQLNETDLFDPQGTGGTMILKNRMTLREGPQAIGCQRMGRVYEAVQYALCLNIPAEPGGTPILRLYGAWPPEWDADFTLAARRGFVVSSSIRKGSIENLDILSKCGEKCFMRNPWPDRQVQLVRDGRAGEVLDGDLLQFSTVVGEKLKLVVL